MANLRSLTIINANNHSSPGARETKKQMQEIGMEWIDIDY